MRSLDRYLNELIDYGGLPATRAEVILDMQRAGHPQPLIDRWLQGQEFAARRDARRQNCCQAPNLLHHSSNH
jgi:hypothetical protein